MPAPSASPPSLRLSCRDRSSCCGAMATRRVYGAEMPPRSIGRIGGAQGNFGVLIRALTYISLLGGQGMLDISANAVLNANYLLHALRGLYDLPYNRPVMHEVVFSAKKRAGASALDVSKRLLDYGFHAPTMYFPLVVAEALMIEPTETESKETLDAFIETLQRIDAEAASDEAFLHGAPLRDPRLPPQRSPSRPPPPAPLAPRITPSSRHRLESPLSRLRGRVREGAAPSANQRPA